MSDVDIEQAKSLHRVAVQSADFCIDRNARLTAQERELIDYTVPSLIEALNEAQEACRTGAIAISKLREVKHDLRTELAATQEKLAAAESQIEADNSRLRYALRDERSRFGLSPSYEDVCSAIGQIEMAMKSLPPAPVRDDARERDLRLIRFTISQFNLKGPFGKLDGPLDTDAPDVLFNFNTQDNSNE